MCEGERVRRRGREWGVRIGERERVGCEREKGVWEGESGMWERERVGCERERVGCERGRQCGVREGESGV